jgi:hypothetical protein
VSLNGVADLVMVGQVFKHRRFERRVTVLAIEGRYAHVRPCDAVGVPIRGRRTQVRIQSDGRGLVYYLRDREAER